MAASVNKSISGVQTRFNKRSHLAPLIKDVPKIITRNSSSKSGLTMAENLCSTTIRKTTSHGKIWRSRRIAAETATISSSLNSDEQIPDIEDKNGKSYEADLVSTADQVSVDDAVSELKKTREEEVKDDVIEVKDDVIEVKDNVMEVKDDVMEVKDDVMEVKDDVMEVKDDVMEVKDDVIEVKDDVMEVKDDVMEVNDSDSIKEKSKTGKQLKTLVHRLAPTPGFVDKNSLPSDLQSRRRVRRLASLNAAAKVNVFFEPSSPLAGRSLTDIMQHSKKVQGGESDCDEQSSDPEKRNGWMKSKARPKLVCISKSDSNYLQSLTMPSKAGRASVRNAGVLNDENIPNGSSLKREQDDSGTNELDTKRTKLDQNGRYATIITNRRFEKGKEVVDVGLQVELPRKRAPGIMDGNRDTRCTCRTSKEIDMPVKSYVSTYANGTLVSIPITKTHKLSPQVPEKPLPELTQGDLACRSKRVAGLNSRAMLNAILTEERKLPSAQSMTKQRKTATKKGFYEHGLNNTVPSTLKIPKINFAATSTSNFSAFGRGKALGGQQGKVTIGGSLWQKSPVLSHDGPKRTNGWFFLGTPIVKPYYYNDYTVIRRYYSGIKRNNEAIYARDSVLLKSGPRRKDLPFVARVSGFWEEIGGPNVGEMMMSVLWYYRPEQTEMGKQPHIHGEDELLASRHKDDNSVACIVNKCYVLGYPEYCRYRADIKRAQDSRIPSATPVPPTQLARSETETLLKADPKLVYFCRKIYDYRTGRIMKNPFMYNSG